MVRLTEKVGQEYRLNLSVPDHVVARPGVALGSGGDWIWGDAWLGTALAAHGHIRRLDLTLASNGEFQVRAGRHGQGVRMP